MKVWVIGSQGMLGSSVLEGCKRQSVEAVGTCRQEADICDLEQLNKWYQEINPTHIVNCAAYTDVDGAEKNPSAAFAVNAQGAANVAKIAERFGVKLVHISTDYVFNGKAQTPYLEESLCAPLNVYGMSKWEGEKKVQEFAPHALIVRTSWIFGSKGKNFISSLLKWFQEKQELQVVSDQSGKPTYCSDLAEAVLKLLDKEGIVHFANEGGHSRLQIATDLLALAQELKIPVKCQKIIPVLSAQFATAAVRPTYSILDTNKYYFLTSAKPRVWLDAACEFLNHDKKI